MSESRLSAVPLARTGMLIRKPAAQVFEAFVDPAITRRFWFSKGSGRLEAGKTVEWTWERYGISVPIVVKAVEPNERILVEWPGAEGPSEVEWRFTPLEGGTTFVQITNSRLAGGADAAVRQALDSTEGFTLVLAGAKALLEHGIELNVVGDRFPEGIAPGPRSLKEIAVEFLTLVAAGQVRDAYRRHVGPSFLHHNPHFRGDAASLLAGMEADAAENPRKSLEVKAALEDGDRVAVLSHMRQRPGDRGYALVHVFRFEGTQIAEAWDVAAPVPEGAVNENGMF